ncbi:WD40 repeat-containing protein [Heterostelium album PN500]|uniref:WD40 repeat-containing protein n=1 Tax=Heterostelium pallidum (strain ATCC 26659 / Pp 5 / PN500) TaxID=670386 RepID=D3BCW0_HETP5|nr:WD40 repeat-containing protein [Heterostelium album PN500]EFA80752.1 WD40 repeat-containing protein [Heterostelium album PN500]|eukprot:XP_020432872.1 WD40 repeat-containing protein [Heterostelium album PN500]
MADDYTFLHQLPDVPLPFVNPNGNAANKWDMKQTKTKPYGYGSVNGITFDSDNRMMVTFNKRVMLFNLDPKSLLSTTAEKNIADYKEHNALCANFRSDARLAAISDEQSNIKLYNLEAKSNLRTFKGHTGSVHVVKFIGKSKLISGSNDHSVRVWDIGDAEESRVIGKHNDQVRALCGHPTKENLWLSGGYDHKVKLWDLNTDTCIHTLDHGAPVEDIIVLKSGAMAVSAGGTHICIWDLLSGKQVYQSRNHVKTITSLYLNSKGTKFLSAGLDHMVKVYSTSTYRVVSTIKFNDPILSMTMNHKKLYVGTTNGNIQVAIKRAIVETNKAKTTGKSNVPTRPMTIVDASKFKCSNVDKLLKKFEHKAAFDSVLNIERRADLFFKVVCELSRREALEKVLEGRDPASLKLLLDMIGKMMQSPKYVSCGVMLVDRVLDIYKYALYEDNETSKQLNKLKVLVREELKRQSEFLKIAGALEILYSNQEIQSSSLFSSTTTTTEVQKQQQDQTLVTDEKVDNTTNNDHKSNGKQQEKEKEEEEEESGSESGSEDENESESESESESEEEVKKPTKVVTQTPSKKNTTNNNNNNNSKTPVKQVAATPKRKAEEVVTAVPSSSQKRSAKKQQK